MDSELVAPAVRRRIVGTMFVVSSLIAAAQIAFFTLSTIIAVSRSGSESVAGVPSTLSMVGRAVAAYPIGWIMGRAGRRLGLSLGLLFGIAGMAISTWAIATGSFWAFSIGSGFAGVARGAVDLGRYAAADVNPPDRRARALGVVIFAGTVGAILGPLMVAPSMRLAELRGYPADSGPYLFGVILSALSLLLVFLFLRPDPMTLSRRYDAAEAREVDAATSGGATLRRLLALGHVRLGVAAMTIGQLVMVMIMVITPLHMSHGGHGTESISLVIMAHTIGMFGLSGVSGWLVDQVKPGIVVIGGSIVLVIASIMSPLTHSVPGLAFALFLLGLGWNMCFVAGSALLSDGLGSVERGRIQGFSDTLAAAAAAVGSLATGPLFASGELLLVSAVGLALSLGLLAAAFLQSQRKMADLPLAS